MTRYRNQKYSQKKMTCLEKFDAFCSVNLAVAESYRAQIGRHPVDRNVLTNWETEMSTRLNDRYLRTNPEQCDALQSFVRQFAANLTNVSFAEFSARMDRVVDELVAEIVKTPNCIVLFCPQPEVGKSGLWLSILYWQKLRHVVTHVFSGVDANVFLRNNYKKHERIYMLYMDDAAYSGIQAYNNMLVPYIGIYDKNLTHIHQCAIIPYISNTALNLLREKFEYCTLWVSQHVSAFDCINIETRITTDTAFWMQFFRYNPMFVPSTEMPFSIPKLHTLYFDHKLPDYVSIYVRIIVYSPIIPGKNETFDIENVTLGPGFITGCKFDITAPPSVSLNGPVYKDKPLELCPKVVYRGLGYVYGNKLPEEKSLTDDIFDYLCINCANTAKYVCGNCNSTYFCGHDCQKIFMIEAQLPCC